MSLWAELQQAFAQLHSCVPSLSFMCVCRPPVRGVQFHHSVPAAVDGSEEVGKDYRHMSADLQVNLTAAHIPAVLFACGCLLVSGAAQMMWRSQLCQINRTLPTNSLTAALLGLMPSRCQGRLST